MPAPIVLPLRHKFSNKEVLAVKSEALEGMIINCGVSGPSMPLLPGCWLVIQPLQPTTPVKLPPILWVHTSESLETFYTFN